MVLFKSEKQVPVDLQNLYKELQATLGILQDLDRTLTTSLGSLNNLDTDG